MLVTPSLKAVGRRTIGSGYSPRRVSIRGGTCPGVGANQGFRTSTALWVPDEPGHRVVKFDLADLRP